MQPVVLSEAEANRRRILPGDFAPCAEAFIDRRNPDSGGKLNYSFIGPGVAQSDRQVVNLPEPHGFQVGGVTLPPGRVNNLHLHFTAEVFVCAAGEWEFIWGNDGGHSARVGEGDVFTIPTWIFRGFINRADESAFLFAALGQDDTGGIVWHPKVLADAENAGLRLTAANRVVDLRAGESKPDGERWMPPMDAAALAELRDISPAEMERFVVRWNSLRWREDFAPDFASRSRRARMAPILGGGLSAARGHFAPLAHPHTFTMEWLEIPPGAEVGGFRLDRPQVLIVHRGSPAVVVNEGEKEIALQMEPRGIFSAPPNSRRAIRNDGKESAVLLLVNGGDERQFPQWDDDVLKRARESGWGLDPGRHVAPLATLACGGLR